MKLVKVIAVAFVILGLTSAAHAENAVTTMHVSARVNAYVRASNTASTPSVETNSKNEFCTVENKDGYTIVHC
ncbi:hypothetical protein AWB71_05322 [Caballeronia peredens]|nr:hypothetical protein AWB71_05322 [Caballeronia peredens]